MIILSTLIQLPHAFVVSIAILAHAKFSLFETGYIEVDIGVCGIIVRVPHLKRI